MKNEVEKYIEIAVSRKKIKHEVARAEINKLLEGNPSKFTLDLRMRKYLEDPTHKEHGNEGSKYGVDKVENHLHIKE